MASVVDTKPAYNQYSGLGELYDEGEEKIMVRHNSLDFEREIKDQQLKFFLRDEGLLFMEKELYCLKYLDLKTITNDEMDALTYNLNTSQTIRFKNAIKSLQARYSRGPNIKPKATKYDDIFKVILVGDCNVGKSSILSRFVNDEFDPIYQTTSSLICQNQIIELEQKNVKLQIYDTSGSHRFGTISKAFFRETHGVLIIYDSTNQQSFDNVAMWIDKMDMCVDEKAWKILVANKCDLEYQRVITKTAGEQLSNQYNIKFIECSAKTGDSIDSIFGITAFYLLSVWDKPNTQNQNNDNKSFCYKCCCVLL